MARASGLVRVSMLRCIYAGSYVQAYLPPCLATFASLTTRVNMVSIHRSDPQTCRCAKHHTSLGRQETRFRILFLRNPYVLQSAMPPLRPSQPNLLPHCPVNLVLYFSFSLSLQRQTTCNSFDAIDGIPTQETYQIRCNFNLNDALAKSGYSNQPKIVC